MNKQETLIKLAQINKATRHVLRTRMIKQAISDEDGRTLAAIALKKQRDKSLLLDVLGGMGMGSLVGAGIGTIGGGISGALGGTAIKNEIGNQWNKFKNQRELELDPNNPVEKFVNTASGAIPVLSTIGGAGTASLAGLPIGAAVGGLYKLFTHGSRKQDAINKLRSLGIED